MIVVGIKQGIKEALFLDSTRPLRLLLAAIEILIVSYLFSDVAQDDLRVMFEVMPPRGWASLLCFHAYFLIVGLTGRYSVVTLFCEGVLGMGIWWVAAITNWATQGVPGPTLACAMAMTVILVNYPTHRRPGRHE